MCLVHSEKNKLHEKSTAQNFSATHISFFEPTAQGLAHHMERNEHFYEPTKVTNGSILNSFWIFFRHFFFVCCSEKLKNYIRTWSIGDEIK